MCICAVSHPDIQVLANYRAKMLFDYLQRKTRDVVSKGIVYKCK